jgi:citrate lyase subunit beta/citryl-CoA lyase
LEDAVPAAGKDQARRDVAAAIRMRDRAPSGGGAPQLHVRIGRGDRGYDAGDLSAVVAPGLHAVRLPKAVSGAEVHAVGERLAWLERAAGMTVGQIAVYPAVESAAGAWHVLDLARAHPRVARLVFGAADFLADIGAPHGADDIAASYARQRLVLASRTAGIGAPVDGAHIALDDPEGLRRAALAARNLGFSGKSAIHPRQVSVIHEVFQPTEAELALAARVLRTYDEAQALGRATAVTDGVFVDAAVAARARRVLGAGPNGGPEVQP